MNMNNLKIAVIQSDIIWEKPSENLKRYAGMIKVSGNPDLVILPEMFSTGFTMEPERVNETMDGESVKWMKDVSKKSNCAITGSLIIEEQGKIFNRCLWVTPDGTVEYYDKKHLFTMSGEDRHYTPGNRKLVVNYKGWRICPLICYDLRFPVWSRNCEEYDLLIYIANWPSSRHQAWKALLPARAVENQSWCIGVNRVGKDGAGLSYKGDSVLVDPKGNADFFGENDQLRMFEINYQELIDFRKKFPVLKDRDKFKLV